MRHGAKEPFYGVKIEDLKKIQKRVKKDHALALALYDTGIGDAQYLAGLISDPPKMTKAELRKWVKTGLWSMVSEYTVAWVAAESRFGARTGPGMDRLAEGGLIATAGWATWSSLVSHHAGRRTRLGRARELLDRVQEEIHTAPNRVRYTMNGFVIAVGG